MRRFLEREGGETGEGGLLGMWAAVGELIVLISFIGGIVRRDSVGVVDRLARDDGEWRVTRSGPAGLMDFDGD